MRTTKAAKVNEAGEGEEEKKEEKNKLKINRVSGESSNI